MKNVKNLFFIICLIAVSVSCKKSDDEKTYEKSQLLGTWKQTAGGTDFMACPSGLNRKIVITDAEMKDYATNDTGCTSDSYLTYDYTFDGKKLTIESGVISMQIVELTATTLKVNTSFIIGGSQSETYTKQ